MHGTMDALQAELHTGAQALGLQLSAQQYAQLRAYLDLLAKWNKVYNLTAVHQPADMLRHHVLDSLAVLPALQQYRKHHSVGRVLDVGSGGGLPGVVLAIACPDMDVTCVDAVAKKAAFVQQVAGALALPRLRGLHARVETLTGPFDLVTSRAFASLADFAAWSAPALAVGGVWMAMKGKYPADEMAALPADVQVFHVEPLRVPGLGAERHLVWMRRGEHDLAL